MDSSRFFKLIHNRSVFLPPLHQMFRAISASYLSGNCRETLGGEAWGEGATWCCPARLYPPRYLQW